jgi:glycolate oxidase FAD binding subunit
MFDLPSNPKLPLTTWNDLDADRQGYLQAAAPLATILAVAAPSTTAEVAAVMAEAQGQGWAVLPYGSGSKLGWGGLVGDANRPLLALCTAQMHQLIDHAIGDLTITAEAGMRWGDLQAHLAQAGQFLPIDPRFPAQATLGGIVATADTGSWRQRYNSVRDLLLGIELVRADGERAKAGGRVVKNVAGYDLMKLLTGSHGTLGVITQVTFRVYPLPPASQTVTVMGAAAAIAQLTQTLLSSALTPTAMDLVWGLPIQGATSGDGLALVVRFQSIPESVAQQGQRLQQLAQGLNLQTQFLAGAAAAALWQEVGAIAQSGAITCKLGVKPSEAVQLWQNICALEANLETNSVGVIHAGTGLGRLVLSQPESVERVRSWCQDTGGFLSILQADRAVKQQLDVWGYRGNALALMQAVKQQFDPQHRLSPHRFVGRI